MEHSPEEPRAILVSLSPRRRRLIPLVLSGAHATAVETPESLDSPLASDPRALVASLALEKLEVALDALGPGDLLMCFDTVVVADEVILGKPSDRDHARRMLRDLSGSTHQVLTAMVLGIPGVDEPHVEVVATDVRMNDLTESDIDAWLASDEPLGCAGAYNIEGQIAAVDENECFQNVAGLPLCHLYRALSDRLDTSSGFEPTEPIARCDALLQRTCRLGPKLLRNRGR